VHDDAEMAAKKKSLAKKSGKTITSTPADPQQFFEDYEQTVQRNL
jgi:hypothetical protein